VRYPYVWSERWHPPRRKRRGFPFRRVGIFFVYGTTCSCGAISPVDVSNRRTEGCARQPLLLSTEGFGVIFCLIFSAPLQSALATNPQESHTYNPRSTRLLSAVAPHSQQVFEVFYSFLLAPQCRVLHPCRQDTDTIGQRPMYGATCSPSY